MDPVTHIASGAVAMLALPERPRTRWALVFGMVAASVPDADVFFSSTPVEFLTIHRGITHSFAGGAVVALLVALAFFWPLRRAEHGWSLGKTWLVAYGLVLLHIWLDVITTYGTQILLPFSDWRARLPGVYIIDPLLTLPLLVAAIVGVWRKGKGRAIAVAAFAWMFIYPFCNLATGRILEARWSERLAGADGRPGVVSVIPEAFSPFVWKLVQDDGDHWRMARIDILGDAPSEFTSHHKVDAVLWQRLGEQEELFRAYDRFGMFLVQEPVSGDGSLVSFRDLRFVTLVPFLRDKLGRGKGSSFQLLARMGQDGRLEAFRFQAGSSGGTKNPGWITVTPR